MERSPLDASVIFWGFVADVLHLAREDLARTPAFLAIADACDEGRPFALEKATLLGPTASVRDSAAAFELAPPLPPGVSVDVRRGMFVFEDCNAMFEGASALLASWPGPLGPAVGPKRAALATCMQRMKTAVATDEAGAALAALWLR